MRTIKIDRRRVGAGALAAAVAAVKAGQVVVFPTETAYGLAADPANRRAVASIFAIKGRSKEKQLPFIAASPAQAEAFVRLGSAARALARRRWPGPLTIVAPVRAGVKLAGAAAGPTAAVRVPALAWARALAAGLGRPVTSTSANLSGQPAVYSPRDIRRVFAGRRRQPDLFLDAGPLPRRRPSTIVRFKRGKIEILRPGPVEVKMERYEDTKIRRK